MIVYMQLSFLPNMSNNPLCFLVAIFAIRLQQTNMNERYALQNKCISKCVYRYTLYNDNTTYHGINVHRCLHLICNHCHCDTTFCAYIESFLYINGILYIFATIINSLLAKTVHRVTIVIYVEYQ